MLNKPKVITIILTLSWVLLCFLIIIWYICKYKLLYSYKRGSKSSLDSKPYHCNTDSKRHKFLPKHDSVVLKKKLYTRMKKKTCPMRIHYSTFFVWNVRRNLVIVHRFLLKRAVMPPFITLTPAVGPVKRRSRVLYLEWRSQLAISSDLRKKMILTPLLR